MAHRLAFICPHCQIGRCSPSYITYVRMHEGMLLRVPNMLAYTCDVCDYQELDNEALIRLEVLVGELDDVYEDAQSMTKPPSLDTIETHEPKPTRRPKP